MRAVALLALLGVLLGASAGCSPATPLPAASPQTAPVEPAPLRDRLMRVALEVIDSSGRPREAFALGDIVEFVETGAAELARRHAPEEEIRRAEERLRDLVLALGPASASDSTGSRGTGTPAPVGAKAGKRRLCPLYPFC